MKRHLRFGKLTWVAAIFLASAVVCQAQGLTTLVSFNGFNGGDPANAPLIQGADGNLYGATQGDGVPHTKGTIFRITSTGRLATLYKFCSQPNCSDGWLPTGVMQATNGSLYGAAEFGGLTSYCSDCGTIFKLSQGNYSVLYSFCSETNCRDGIFPGGTLVQGNNGNLYGMAFCGGTGPTSANCPEGAGTIFEITPAGEFTTIYSFCSQVDCADGGEPSSSLVIGPNGSLFGATSVGGTSALGTLFELSAAGKLTIVHNFTAGEHGLITLMLAGDGSLYGTSSYGYDGGGVIFKVTPAGEFTTLYSFCAEKSCPTGSNPQAPLVEGSDGNFYGTASLGGASNNGIMFKITPEGNLTDLYSFCSKPNCADGSGPDSLMQATNGSLYGMTQFGGSGGYGTLFEVSTGLGPFVAESPIFGKVGQIVAILGDGLTGTTSVTFNGAAAAFKVESNTYLQATVPSGATNGPIAVTTPDGTLTSNIPFQVLP